MISSTFIDNLGTRRLPPPMKGSSVLNWAMGWTKRCSNSVTGKRSFSSPNPPDPPSILFSGYRWLFLGSKGGRIVKLTIHLHLVPRLRISAVIYLCCHYTPYCRVGGHMYCQFQAGCVVQEFVNMQAPLVSRVFRLLQCFSCDLLVTR
jgi:hypothetical protein